MALIATWPAMDYLIVNREDRSMRPFARSCVIVGVLLGIAALVITANSSANPWLTLAAGFVSSHMESCCSRGGDGSRRRNRSPTTGKSRRKRKDSHHCHQLLHLQPHPSRSPSSSSSETVRTP
jgi:hypothetical protein